MLIDNFLLVRIQRIFIKLFLAKMILLLIPVSHLASLVMVFPKYLKLFSCSICLSCHFIVVLGGCLSLQITITFVFSTFMFKYFSSLSSFTLLNTSCNCLPQLATNTVSSAYRGFFIIFRQFLHPRMFYTSHNNLPYIENSSGDSTQPCLTPLCIPWKSAILPFVSTHAF